MLVCPTFVQKKQVQWYRNYSWWLNSMLLLELSDRFASYCADLDNMAPDWFAMLQMVGDECLNVPPRNALPKLPRHFHSSRQVKLAWGQLRQHKEFWIGSVAILESFVEIVLISPWKICILKSFWLPLMEPDEMLMWRLQGSAQWFAGKISCSSSGHHLPRKLALLKTSISQIYLVLLDVSPFSGFLYCWVLWSCEASGISFRSALPRFKCASGVDPATACAMYAALAPCFHCAPGTRAFHAPLEKVSDDKMLQL